MVEVACLMMQKNEDDLLEPWLLYYGDLFGYENLFIFDNGSTSPKPREILLKYAKKGMNVDFRRNRPADFDRHGYHIGRKIRALEAEKRFDLFMPVDCDEFLVLDGDDGPSCDAGAIHRHLAEFVEVPGTLSIGCSFVNSVRHPAHYWRHEFQKIVFTRAGGCRWLSRGFHEADARRPGPPVATRLAQLHFHYKPYSILAAHARNKLEYYVDTNDREALEKFTGPGWHAVRHLLCEPAEYYASQGNTDWLIGFPQLTEKLSGLGADPFWERWAAMAEDELSGRAPDLAPRIGPPKRGAARLIRDLRFKWRAVSELMGRGGSGVRRPL